MYCLILKKKKKEKVKKCLDCKTQHVTVFKKKEKITMITLLFR